MTRCTDVVLKLEEVRLTGSGVTGALIPVTATISAPPSGETMHQTSKRFRGGALTSHSAGGSQKCSVLPRDAMLAQNMPKRKNIQTLQDHANKTSGGAKCRWGKLK